MSFIFLELECFLIKDSELIFLVKYFVILLLKRCLLVGIGGVGGLVVDFIC